MRLKLDMHCYLPHPGQPSDPSWCWAPPSCARGLGGSEEAVVHLARELAALDYEVTVFNPCGPMAGVYDGVRYRPVENWRPDEPCDVLVSWRRIIFLETAVAARLKMLWLHDAPEIPDWLLALPGGEAYRAPFARFAETVDRVAVLSRYHGSRLPPQTPSEKILWTRNGIHVDDFRSRQAVPRDPARVIYATSYARGLEHLLRMWPRVIAAVPAANLHVFYGFQSAADEAQAQRLRALLAQPGVFEHGQIGHLELIDEYRRSGIFAYPCDTPEMFSIATVKAQACGCVPIVTAQGALAEVTRAGVVVPGKGGEADTDEKFASELIRLLRDVTAQERLRSEVQNTPLEDWSWKGVAEQWDLAIREELVRVDPKAAEDTRRVDR